MAVERKHRVSIVVENREIDRWKSYSIESNMITPADAFTLTRPFNPDVWNLLRKDARVRVLIDGVVIVDGFIDKRQKRSKADEIEVGGRDRVGRLVQESAESINYEGLLLLDAVKKLVDPWFSVVTLSDARNRSLRRGKGRRVSSAAEPLVINIRVPRAGKVHPGMTRWAIIEEIVSQAGYIAWSSADGREIFIGKPNYNQSPQYLVAHTKPGSRTKNTVTDLIFDEDNGDRYSLITVAGAGGSDEDDVNFGTNVTSRKGRWKDGDGVDGVGRDFIYPKRLYMPERNFDSNGDAQRVADREAARRNYRARTAQAVMPQHGQFLITGAPTIFAPNTIARVVDEDFSPMVDENFLVTSCKYDGDRDGAETTTLELVPSGTEIVL
jgi:prophage tail gpP-like protein